uniref:Uncharacterized protein n=1 Tax=Cacopsylla melanoneura TaxID=428564 RepID=A0A8D9DZ79_9HEMI
MINYTDSAGSRIASYWLFVTDPNDLLNRSTTTLPPLVTANKHYNAFYFDPGFVSTQKVPLTHSEYIKYKNIDDLETEPPFSTYGPGETPPPVTTTPTTLGSDGDPTTNDEKATAPTIVSSDATPIDLANVKWGEDATSTDTTPERQADTEETTTRLTTEENTTPSTTKKKWTTTTTTTTTEAYVEPYTGIVFESPPSDEESTEETSEESAPVVKAGPRNLPTRDPLGRRNRRDIPPDRAFHSGNDENKVRPSDNQVNQAGGRKRKRRALRKAFRSAHRDHQNNGNNHGNEGKNVHNEVGHEDGGAHGKRNERVRRHANTGQDFRRAYSGGKMARDRHRREVTDDELIGQDLFDERDGEDALMGGGPLFNSFELPNKKPKGKIGDQEEEEEEELEKRRLKSR